MANTGNISKAAARLYISQPAISKSIRKLEENLEVSLFSRNSRGVQLTEEGELLYHYVQNAFYSLEKGETQIKKIHELGIGHIHIGVSTTLCKYVLLPYLKEFIETHPHISLEKGETQIKKIHELGIGHIHIGVSTTLCKYVLLPYLKEFIETHPHIRISIECQSTNQTLQLLKENKIDLGLIGKPERLYHTHFDSLGEIEDIFVCTKSYMEHLSKRSDYSENPFQSATLMLLNKGNMTRQYIDDFLESCGMEAVNLLEVSTMELLIEFAIIGLGIACVIRQFVEKELAEGALIEVPLPSAIIRREIGFALPENIEQNKASKEIINFDRKSTSD